MKNPFEYCLKNSRQRKVAGKCEFTRMLRCAQHDKLRRFYSAIEDAINSKTICSVAAARACQGWMKGAVLGYWLMSSW